MLISAFRFLTVIFLIGFVVVAVWVTTVDQATLRTLPIPLQQLRGVLVEQGSLIETEVQKIFASPLSSGN